MKFRSTIIFGIILIALAGYVYFFEIQGAERGKKAERTSKEVLSFEKDKIEEVTLLFADRTIRCVMDTADVWKLVEPIEAYGSKEDIQRILNSLEDATVRRTVADSVESLADYGLDEPYVIVTIKQQDEDERRSVLLGDKNPTDTFVYAKRADRPTIFLVSSSLLSSLDKHPNDLRFRKVLDFEKSEIKRIVLKHNGKSIACSKTFDQWMLEKPIQARADGNAIDTIVSTLLEAEAKEFVAEEIENEATYGLDRAEVTVDLFLGERNVMKSLSIGTRKGNMYYAKDASRDQVFAVDSSLVSKLKKDVFDLRDKSVLAIKPYTVEQIRLQIQELDLVCRKDTTGTWHILEPIQARADESKINDLLWDLEGLKAEEFVSDAPEELAPYGLSEPSGHIELWIEKDSTTQKLLIGDVKGRRVYVKNSAAPSIYLVDSEVLEEMGKELTDFRDKKILNFYTHGVRGIEIVHGDETSTWGKDSKGNWKGPSGRSVKKSDMTGFLSDLQSLQAEEFVEDSPSDLTRYGLAEPRYSVFIRFDDKPPQVLLIGGEMENGFVYVKNRKIDTVYSSKSEFVKKLKALLPEQEET